ncbi:hypothetical protein RRG08_041931 [Elysia crispata]|uniref:Uncharacterized protein n=1 Tax=Elysia crispata TaxID=231223 RepID=A0AAE0XWZ7_9GAST|nr:hypothetical protein RRG08_041931 [Elysia crispata]
MAAPNTPRNRTNTIGCSQHTEKPYKYHRLLPTHRETVQYIGCSQHTEKPYNTIGCSQHTEKPYKYHRLLPTHRETVQYQCTSCIQTCCQIFSTSLAKFLYKRASCYVTISRSLKSVKSRFRQLQVPGIYLDGTGGGSPQQFALHLSQGIFSQISGHMEMDLKQCEIKTSTAEYGNHDDERLEEALRSDQTRLWTWAELTVSC